MKKVAIALMTKDRCELTERTIKPLLDSKAFDLWVIDGSDTEAGRKLPGRYQFKHFRSNVRGGADPAIAYALTELLRAGYEYIGICESDVLLHKDFFGPMFALFERGKADGLEVGVVSARAYVDRILCQRDDYALMHNTGFGQQLYTRKAAKIALENFRTHWSAENRRVFVRLSGLDIGTWWAFRTNEHWCCPDWGMDAVLASHGLASLALVPSPVEMVGQKPSLREQGLELAQRPVEDRRNDDAFTRFAETTAAIRAGSLNLGGPPVRFRGDDGNEIIFAHQLNGLPAAEWTGDWRLKWSPGLGGFAARGFADATFTAMISGAAKFMVLGGEKGGQVAIEDLKSKYIVRPTLMPEISQQVTQVIAPAGVSYRPVRITVLSGSCIFFGIGCMEPQPVSTANGGFDHSKLWPVA